MVYNVERNKEIALDKWQITMENPELQIELKINFPYRKSPEESLIDNIILPFSKRTKS